MVATPSPRPVAPQPDSRSALLADHVARIIKDWPALSEQQIDRVAALFHAGSVA